VIRQPSELLRQTAGAARIDLNGDAAGVVSDADAARATTASLPSGSRNWTPRGIEEAAAPGLGHRRVCLPVCLSALEQAPLRAVAFPSQ
jgi:hypothetical protein